MSLLALLVALALAASPSSSGPSSSPPATTDPLDARRGMMANEVMRLARELRREIETGDVEAISARVPLEGLKCAGQIVPRARVLRDLKDPEAWLHGVLLGGPGYSPPHGVEPSLRTLFADALRVEVVIAFRADESAGPVGIACLDFRANNRGTPGFPLCFVKRAGRFWFTESLYPCA